MFKFLEKWFTKEDTLDDILSCAKYIIDNGELVEDNSSDTATPSLNLKDDKGNTLYVRWSCSTGYIYTVYINDRHVPTSYHHKIFYMARKRINYLQKKYLEETIKSVKK